MILFLIGFRAVGKTSIGRNLAETLQFNHIDSDIEFEKKYGTALAEHAASVGAAQFRKDEKSIIQDCLHNLDPQKNYIFSLGGGFVEHPPSCDLLKDHRNQINKIIYLRAQPKILWDRIMQKNQDSRAFPLQDYASMQSLLESRIPRYEELSNLTIDCETFDINAICNLIQKKI